jgi:threonyl-tRNA synthetase
LKELGVDYYEAIGEAAFYGPKLDVQVKSAIGHDVTLSTIQLDYQLPERFELTYIDEKSEKARPVVVHRAILGSLDRFIAFLIEETKGAFPTWLAPVQVNILPVNNAYHLEYAKDLLAKFKEHGLRVEMDDSNEKLGYRMRNSQMRKIPFALVLGDSERDNKTVTYRRFGAQEQITVTIDEFLKLIDDEIKNRTMFVPEKK